MKINKIILSLIFISNLTLFDNLKPNDEENYQKRKSRNTFLGGIFGGGIGAGIGAAVSNSSPAGALVGLGVGAVGGAAFGNATTHKDHRINRDKMEAMEPEIEPMEAEEEY